MKKFIIAILGLLLTHLSYGQVDSSMCLKDQSIEIKDEIITAKYVLINKGNTDKALVYSSSFDCTNATRNWSLRIMDRNNELIYSEHLHNSGMPNKKDYKILKVNDSVSVTFYVEVASLVIYDKVKRTQISLQTLNYPLYFSAHYGDGSKLHKLASGSFQSEIVKLEKN